MQNQAADLVTQIKEKVSDNLVHLGLEPEHIAPILADIDHLVDDVMGSNPWVPGATVMGVGHAVPGVVKKSLATPEGEVHTVFVRWADETVDIAESPATLTLVS